MLILFLVCEKKRVEFGISLAFVSRLRPDSVTCLFGTQCISVQEGTAHAPAVTEILCVWTLIPCQLKHLQLLRLISSSCHQEHWQYPLFSTHAWTRLSLSFFFLILHQNLAFEWLSAHKQKTTAACCALSCPKIWGPLLHSGEQRRRETNKLPAPEIPQKAAYSVPQWHPSQLGGLLDICNAAHCALDATALIVFSRQRAIAFPLAATLYLLGLILITSGLEVWHSLAKLPALRTGLPLLCRWQSGVQRLQHDLAMGWECKAGSARTEAAVTCAHHQPEVPVRTDFCLSPSATDEAQYRQEINEEAGWGRWSKKVT